MKNIIINCFLLSFIFGLNTTKAWIYPEHREITLLAIEKLSADYRISLDELWPQARVDYELRLVVDWMHYF